MSRKLVPMIWKERTIHRTEEIGISRPSTYSVFKHSNCIGCLKAGWQQRKKFYQHRYETLVSRLRSLVCIEDEDQP